MELPTWHWIQCWLQRVATSARQTRGPVFSQSLHVSVGANVRHVVWYRFKHAKHVTVRSFYTLLLYTHKVVSNDVQITGKYRCDRNRFHPSASRAVRWPRLSSGWCNYCAFEPHGTSIAVYYEWIVYKVLLDRRKVYCFSSSSTLFELASCRSSGYGEVGVRGRNTVGTKHFTL